jgi:hypothetical protein
MASLVYHTIHRHSGGFRKQQQSCKQILYKFRVRKQQQSCEQIYGTLYDF